MELNHLEFVWKPIGFGQTARFTATVLLRMRLPDSPQVYHFRGVRRYWLPSHLTRPEPPRWHGRLEHRTHTIPVISLNDGWLNSSGLLPKRPGAPLDQVINGGNLRSSRSIGH